ncbi:hypothetical protein [Pseudomonas sp. BF-RE-26]|uniref:hypothetical protein n=1 Tax=Pseudomonas sp. BF-RE-26 TaxID=2832396 RepID=UPI001CBF9E58|nr:hypothetical protein [Pseudomonas sp. BF-RE-26]
MIDIDKECKKIEGFEFFSSMGSVGSKDNDFLYIESVRKVFLEPSESEFDGCYEGVEWLPTSPAQPDPFYDIPKPPSDLVAMRMKVNKAVMAVAKTIDKNKFICTPHDFNLAARNAVCFAFRQYVSESYYGLGDRWLAIIKLYYSGRWPVGLVKDKIVVI